MKKSKIGIGLYGTNGHQVTHLLERHEKAVLTAAAGMDEKSLQELRNKFVDFQVYNSLDEMLADANVVLVSLCSPNRKNQALESVQCLKAGKHVYAEKPCALTERELNEIMEAVKESGLEFHEMAGTAFEEPYLSIRQLVKKGTIGDVVQIFAQKSYPYYDERPQEEDIDGGLTRQAGIHALRMIEHAAGTKIKEIIAVETSLGNPNHGGLKMAVSMAMALENGGIASAIANYLNPKGFGRWGNETLRIFGTEGMIEAVDGGTRTRLVVKDQDRGEIEVSAQEKDYFDRFIDALLGIEAMPLTLEEELHPTRMIIRAKDSVK